jgi:hypothetical protein
MASTVSSLDAEAMARARALLRKPERRARMWPVLAAAAALAVASLGFATAMISAPALVTEHVAHSAPG